MRESVSEREQVPPVPEPTPEPAEAPPRWPLLVVAGVVLFNLVVLHAEARPVQSLNDSSVHRSMIAWAEQRIEDGHLPLDGWYPDLALGSSRFHHYQSLPHILTGMIALAIGSRSALSWTLYLGLALWPIAVYAGGRLLGWDRWICAIAALASPLIVSEPNLGYEWGSYAWRGYGTWSQLWGMWLLPFAWGTSWQAVANGRRYWLAALLLALTIACHLLTGYLALLSLGVFALVRWRELVRRIGRAALVGFGSLLVAAWVVVPLLADRAWTVNDEFSRGKFYYDSFGAKKILGWLVSGELFDRGRSPLVTILVVVGLLVALWRYRREERARVVLFLFMLSLVLFFGRPTLGPVLRVLPGSGDLFLRRFVFGVHLAGLYLVGLGAVAVGRIARQQLQRVRPLREQPLGIVVLGVAAVVVLFAPGFVERTAWAAQGAGWIDDQAVANATDGANVAALVRIAQARGPGRFYSGMRSNWGSTYRVGQVPIYIMLLNEGVEGVGFVRPTWSLSAPVEYRFTDSNPSHYDLFGVRYTILGRDRPPPVPAEKIAQRGRHVLWELPNPSYVDLVDVLPPITADRTDLGIQVADWLHSDLPGRHANPGIAFEGHPAPPPTTTEEALPSRRAGRVLSQQIDLSDGRATVTVDAQRPAMVMLKASFDPRWQVTVDGVPQAPQMIAPSFVGREVSAGRHTVRFVYEPFPRYDVMLLVGLVTLIGLAVVPRRVRARRERRRAHEPEPPREPTPEPSA